ncbi:MAG: CsbD family protein [Bradyrhizobium sp.]|uniref:CsbD family protein n=1 Tax=Bradyrhizobium sp. TaxID=376 RepID=UPI0025C147FE|nr:CsbD family protein [Bradyrhizobium sp.]MBI5264690.1 CsbD family protein [Bradyrhizobium sp.]
MSKAKGVEKKIVGTAKQVVGEIVGDQTLQEEGRAQEQRGCKEREEPSELNPFRKLGRLT